MKTSRGVLLLAAAWFSSQAAAQPPHPHGPEPQAYVPPPSLPLPPAPQYLIGRNPLPEPGSLPVAVGVAPPLPPHLMAPPRSVPGDRMATPPEALTTRIVADRIRLTDTTQPPSKLGGVEVEVVKGGYRVTKKYEDYSSVLSDGRPRYLWEVTYFVSEGEIKVKAPEGGQPPVGTQPPPPRPDTPSPRNDLKPVPGTTEKPIVKTDLPSNPAVGRDAQPKKDDPVKALPPSREPVVVRPETTGGRKGVDPNALAHHETSLEKRENPTTVHEPIVIRPEDISGRIAADPHGLERQLRETGDSFQGTVIHDRFSTEFEKATLDALVQTGKVGLELGRQLPVAGTVIAGGEAFQEQYDKTYRAFIDAGFDAGRARREALLQATVVAGGAVIVDVATGKVLDKLKLVAKNPLLKEAADNQGWKKADVEKLDQTLDKWLDVGAEVSGTVLKEITNAEVKTDPRHFGGPPGGFYFAVQ